MELRRMRKGKCWDTTTKSEENVNINAEETELTWINVADIMKEGDVEAFLRRLRKKMMNLKGYYIVSRVQSIGSGCLQWKHLIGPKGVSGLLTISAALVLSTGIVLFEPVISNIAYKDVVFFSPSLLNLMCHTVNYFSLIQVSQKLFDAGKAMWTTLKCPQVWWPCLYMNLSFVMCLNINEGLVSTLKFSPSSQESIGYIFSIGAVGAILGAILYQNKLKDEPFRDLLLWIQLFFDLKGMLDLILVLRMNLKFWISNL
ncbi:hypothetical protein J1N35_003419 [Gossypium stocksii]|uniref:Uncharacterized protein n=1 Tax=Gossypium stocksii TaxID=47602 RepID=A0A9D4AGT5_9ROSI|nr:hypothetical protein J1N35_003419 [Gossypium stocksii]